MTSTVQFDVTQAREALSRAVVTENRPGGLEFARFTLPNYQNETRTVISVNHHGGEIHVRIDIVTLYCPDEGLAQRHELICGGDFHFVEEVEYDKSKVDPSVTFRLPNKSGVPSWVTVHNDGRWHFKVA